MLAWISSYLHDRQLYVPRSDHDAQFRSVTRAVHQGEILSPTSFNIDLIRLASHLPIHLSKNVEATSYADDICM